MCLQAESRGFVYLYLTALATSTFYAAAVLILAPILLSKFLYTFYFVAGKMVSSIFLLAWMPFLRCQNHTPFSVSPSHIYVCAFLVPFETHMQGRASKRFLFESFCLFSQIYTGWLGGSGLGVNSKNLRKLNKRGAAVFDTHKFFGKRLHTVWRFCERTIMDAKL